MKARMARLPERAAMSRTLYRRLMAIGVACQLSLAVSAADPPSAAPDLREYRTLEAGVRRTPDGNLRFGSLTHRPSSTHGWRWK